MIFTVGSSSLEEEFTLPPMPSRSSDDHLSNAILQSVEDGLYPEDEDIVSAKLPPSALTSLSELLEQARADVKVREPQLFPKSLAN